VKRWCGDRGRGSLSWLQHERIAHHSFRRRSSTRGKPIKLSGQPSQGCLWSNPHAWIYSSTSRNADGKVVKWGFETGGVNARLYRRGWRKEDFHVGTVRRRRWLGWRATGNSDCQPPWSNHAFRTAGACLPVRRRRRAHPPANSGKTSRTVGCAHFNYFPDEVVHCCDAFVAVKSSCWAIAAGRASGPVNNPEGGAKASGAQYRRRSLGKHAVRAARFRSTRTTSATPPRWAWRSQEPNALGPDGASFNYQTTPG